MQTELLISTITAFALIVIAVRLFWQKYVNLIDVPMHHLSIHTHKGRFVALLEPGRYHFFGGTHQFQQFDTRLQQIALQTQELITSEGITVKLTAVGHYRITDPIAAVAATSDFNATLYTLIQLALRDVINGVGVEALLRDVRSLGPRLHSEVKNKVAALGIDVTELVIRDVIIPSEIKAALSETWRSKKSALAEIETARGKAAAARTLANAARLYETNPALLKIRYIEALEQATKSMGNTLIIGMPDDKALKLI